MIVFSDIFREQVGVPNRIPSPPKTLVRKLDSWLGRGETSGTAPRPAEGGNPRLRRNTCKMKKLLHFPPSRAASRTQMKC
jgi:hypothetical protein